MLPSTSITRANGYTYMVEGNHENRRKKKKKKKKAEERKKGKKGGKPENGYEEQRVPLKNLTSIPSNRNLPNAMMGIYGTEKKRKKKKKKGFQMKPPHHLSPSSNQELAPVVSLNFGPTMVQSSWQHMCSRLR